MGDVKAHSIFAPSASKRWMTCPGSIKLSEKAPPQKDTPEAIQGTDAHWVFEQSLKERLSAYHFVHSKMPSGKKCTRVMAEFVQKSVDYVLAHHLANGGQIYTEMRLEMPKIDKRMFGSGDIIQITKFKTLHIFDLKYGLWQVDPEQNMQLMCYAIGALTKFKDQIDLTKPVTAHICQPRIEHKDGFNRSTKFTIKELIEFGKLAKIAIKESDQPNARLVDGEHCTFCPAEFICPKLNSFGRKAFNKPECACPEKKPCAYEI